MSTYTVGLSEVGHDDLLLLLLGGKAAGLAGLIREGFPVPDGFVVTTDAYRDFAAAAGLADEDREPPASWPSGSPTRPYRTTSPPRSRRPTGTWEDRPSRSAPPARPRTSPTPRSPGSTTHS